MQRTTVAFVLLGRDEERLSTFVILLSFLFQREGNSIEPTE